MVRIAAPTISIGMAVQPDVIYGLGQKPGFMGRGLLARFKYFLPSSRIGYRRVDPPELSRGIRDDYREMILAILNTPHNPEGYYDLVLNKKAKKARDDMWIYVEQELREGGKYENMGGWGKKMVGSAIRLAGILHIAEYCHDGPFKYPIDEITFGSARDIMFLLGDHALVALDAMTDSEEIRKAKKIWAWIAKKKTDSITGRQIQQRFKKTYKTVSEIQPGIDMLIEKDFIRDSTPNTQRNKIYLINPMAFST
jgi:hypothetical protein